MKRYIKLIQEIWWCEFNSGDIDMWGMGEWQEGNEWGAETVHRARYFLAFWAFLRQMVLVTICTHKGHDWVDESYGGPESGAMDMYCDRCGYHFHHQLY